MMAIRNTNEASNKLFKDKQDNSHKAGMDIIQAIAMTEGSQAEEIMQLRAELNHKQFLIDSLMLEYCPDDMTQEQLEEWARNQRRSGEQ